MGARKRSTFFLRIPGSTKPTGFDTVHIDVMKPILPASAHGRGLRDLWLSGRPKIVYRFASQSWIDGLN